MLISLIAKKDMTYCGRSLSAGDFFEATPIEAAALTYQSKARFARKTDRKEVEAVEEEYGLNEIVDEVPPIRKKRQYRRRDLRAEE